MNMRGPALAFAPGQLVIAPDRPDWGLGTVQSAIGNRVTVMFEEAGKVMMDITHSKLEPAPNS